MSKLQNLCPSGGGARMERPWLGADGNQNAAPVRDDPSLYTKCADRDGERASRATIILVGAVIRPLFTSQDESRAIVSARSHEVSIVSVPVSTIRIHRLLGRT
jgi:hypothetical protein